MIPRKRKLQSGRSFYQVIEMLKIFVACVVAAVIVVATDGSLQLRSQQTDTLGEHGH